MMIKFAELLAAVNASAQSAGEALNDQVQRILDRYFVGASEPVETKKILGDLITEARSLSETGASGDAIRRLSDSLANVSESMDQERRALQARCVSIEYPAIGENGPTTHTVHAPLIALIPFSGVRLTKLVFRANLDLHLHDDGSIGVTFPSHPQSGEGFDEKDQLGTPQDKRGSSSIEITVEGTPAPDGLRKIIEGYERALRAQIPG